MTVDSLMKRRDRALGSRAELFHDTPLEVDLARPEVQRRKLPACDASCSQAAVEFAGAPAELLAGSNEAADLSS
jgi:hypothetical protein